MVVSIFNFVKITTSLLPINIDVFGVDSILHGTTNQGCAPKTFNSVSKRRITVNNGDIISVVSRDVSQLHHTEKCVPDVHLTGHFSYHLSMNYNSVLTDCLSF